MNKDQPCQQTLNWPFGVDLKSGQFMTGPLPKSIASETPFLDHRLPKECVQAARPETFATLRERLRIADTKPVGYTHRIFIFHSAFCGSTLLSQLLDSGDEVLSLSEPHVITQIAHGKRSLGVPDKSVADDTHLSEALDISLAMMGQHSAEMTLIKPSNFANNLIPDLLQRCDRALFLYGSLESFLRSLMRRGFESGVFIRQLWQAMLADKGDLSRIPLDAAVQYSDLQIAAILWTYQLETFGHYLRNADQKQCRSICFDKFDNDPQRFALAVQAFLTPSTDPAQLTAKLAEGALERDSKTGGDRSAIEQDEMLSLNDEAILADTLKWAQQVRFSPHSAIPLPSEIELTS